MRHAARIAFSLCCAALLAVFPLSGYAHTPSPQPTAPAQLDAKVLTLQEQGHTFIANKKSGVLHIDTCETLPDEKNRLALDSFEQGLLAGYEPCGECLYWVNADGTSADLENTQQEYIGNVKSGKFHRSDSHPCRPRKTVRIFQRARKRLRRAMSPADAASPEKARKGK